MNKGLEEKVDKIIMKKQTIRTMVLMMLCTVGGILIGLNAGHLSNEPNVALFTLGVAFVSLTITAEGLFQTVWKRKNNK